LAGARENLIQEQTYRYKDLLESNVHPMAGLYDIPKRDLNRVHKTGLGPFIRCQLNGDSFCGFQTLFFDDSFENVPPCSSTRSR
jgi:hypothetical protein